MTFSCIKQEDRRRPARYHVKSYDSNGKLVSEFDRVSTGLKLGKLRTTLFNRTKNYRPGRFSVNPFDARSCTGECESSSQILQYRYGGKTYVSRRITGEVLAYFAGGSWDITNPVPFVLRDKERTHIKAFAKMNAPDLDLGTPLGELKELIGSLTNPLKGVRSLLMRMANKAPKSSKKRAIKYLSDAWLEYRYDIMPNVLTAADIIGYFEQKKRSLTSLERKVSMMLGPKVTTGPQIYTSDLEGYSFTWRLTRVTEQRTVTRVFYQFKSVDPDMGVSLADVPRVAWELTPYSFVVDWFFGVGDWLTAHRNLGDRVLLGVTHGTKYTERVTAQAISIFNPYIVAYEAIGGLKDYTFEVNKFVRSTGDTDLPALPLVNKNIVKLNRLADSMALSLAYLPKCLSYR